MTRRDTKRIAYLSAAQRRNARLGRPTAATYRIARLIAERGAQATDEWLASTCAMSIERVRKHRSLLER